MKANRRWINIFESQFGVGDEGSTRVVYHCLGGVIKIPLTNYGAECNIHEHVASCDSDGLWPMAKAFLIDLDPAIPILWMEKIRIPETKELFLYTKRNPWTEEIDSYQVGYNNHGAMVAYDYGGEFHKILNTDSRKRMAQDLFQQFNIRGRI